MKTDNILKHNIQILLSILLVIAGTALMVIKIVLDSEPGAVPLLMIILSTAWFFLNRNQLQTRQA